MSVCDVWMSTSITVYQPRSATAICLNWKTMFGQRHTVSEMRHLSFQWETSADLWLQINKTSMPPPWCPAYKSWVLYRKDSQWTDRYSYKNCLCKFSSNSNSNKNNKHSMPLNIPLITTITATLRIGTLISCSRTCLGWDDCLCILTWNQNTKIHWMAMDGEGVRSCNKHRRAGSLSLSLYNNKATYIVSHNSTINKVLHILIMTFKKEPSFTSSTWPEEALLVRWVLCFSSGYATTAHWKCIRDLLALSTKLGVTWEERGGEMAY